MDQPNAAISTADALRAELAPIGTLQRFLVDQMGRAMDRLARLDAVEDPADPANPAHLRLQSQAERSFYKAMTEFRRQLRAASKAEQEAARAETPPAAAVAPSTPKKSRAATSCATHARPAMPGTDDEILARHPSFDLGDPVDRGATGHEGVSLTRSG